MKAETLLLALPLAMAIGLSGSAMAKPQPHAPPPHRAAKAPHEKLVRAPGGVVVPKPAPPGNSPGFMDDGAKKRGEKR